MRYIGIDYGTKRVGVALSDESGTLAFPHTVLRPSPDLPEHIATIAKDSGAEHIVLGESLNYKNEPNALMKEVERFKVELEKLGLFVVYEPEQMSSMAAERFQGKHEANDASAAAIILQWHLDKKANSH